MICQDRSGIGLLPWIVIRRQGRENIRIQRICSQFQGRDAGTSAEGISGITYKGSIPAAQVQRGQAAAIRKRGAHAEGITGGRDRQPGKVHILRVPAVGKHGCQFTGVLNAHLISDADLFYRLVIFKSGDTIRGK